MQKLLPNSLPIIPWIDLVVDKVEDPTLRLLHRPRGLESKGGERKLGRVLRVRKDLFSSRVPEICHSPDDDDEEEEEDDADEEMLMRR